MSLTSCWRGQGRGAAALAAILANALLGGCAPPSPQAVSPAPPPMAAPAQPQAQTDDSAAAQFAALRLPSSGSARVFGTYTSGCIAGAHQLPVNATLWQVLNPSRNRAWGHPDLLRFIDGLARNVALDGYRGLLVGDLAQPRGGPLPSDHNSHQVGLDADIWLTPLPQRRFSMAELESFDAPSMVDLETLRVNGLFGPAQQSMLRHAAEHADVERIFVSPPIKQALCEAHPGAAWLRKVRPWRGHMAHMHVRLGCPPGSDDCKTQEPPPDGDGCGAELASWLRDRSWTRLPEEATRYVPEKAPRLASLPRQCQSLLRMK